MLATAIIVFREVTSSILSENSMLGLLLHVLIGYPAQLAGIEVISYLATLPGIGTLMRVMGRGPPSAPSRPAVAASI
jgi:high-affinity iron transporter